MGYSDRESLCWRCKRPGTRTCSWDDSKGNVPVEGWTAEVSSIRGNNTERVRSYHVIDFPLFVPEENYEERRKHTASEVDPKREKQTKSILTEKRKAIERLFRYGRSNREIANKFGLAIKTVQKYRTRWRKEQKK